MVRWFGSGYLVPHGSLENPEDCEYYVATKGGTWSFIGSGKFTTYGPDTGFG